MTTQTWRFVEMDQDRWILEHGDGMSVTVLYSNESNRAFLLRILNAHDALVAALDAVMDGASDFGGDYSAGMPDSLRLAMEQGEAALRMAKGEAA